MISRILVGLMAAGVAATAFGADDVVVSTDAYRWQGDTIYQNEFKAWAESPEHIVSTYKGRPGYYMGVEQEWMRKNDLSSYPRLHTGNKLHEAIYNMGLDEMVNAVEPDTTLRTGKEWSGVWTRDVSYSIILSMAALQPEASMISLMKKVNPSGQIIQDTGSGGAWPISTDRMVWVLAAWEIYKVTGDKAWLEKVYPIALRSLEKDEKTVMSADSLVKGETSFIDWREQSYPLWMQTVDISQSEAFGTNVMYAAALKAASDMAGILGKKKEAAMLTTRSESLAKAIDARFWMPGQGMYAMYSYGRDNKILNPRAETLGLALSILYDVAPAEKVKDVSQHNPTTPFGPAIFFPQTSDKPNYHNNALWPFVGSYWTLAQAKAGNEQGVVEGIGAIFRPAALFATNKENFNLDNGDFYTELNSSNMLWSLSGNLALTQRILFGINYQKDGLLIAPFVPKAFAGDRTLENVNYRGARLNIEVKGYGAGVKSITLNGKALKPGEVIPASKLKKGGDIVVEMDCLPIAPMTINRTPNVKAPITPSVRISHDPMLVGRPGAPIDNLLEWNPIEYIGEYVVLRNGKEVGRTHQTRWEATEPGEWQVYGVSGEGVPGFASEPIDNRAKTIVEFPDETTAMTSAEVSYQPKVKMEGWTGAGFREIDRTTAPLAAKFVVKVPGIYTIAFRYANGNGPVNTENKAAIRTLNVDGKKMGTVVMPHRGVANWNDWGMTNQIRVPLEAGEHELQIIYLPENENMNISTNHALIDDAVITRAE